MKLIKAIKDLTKTDIDLICDYQFYTHGNCLKCRLEAFCSVSDNIYDFIQKCKKNKELSYDLERRIVVCDLPKEEY